MFWYTIFLYFMISYIHNILIVSFGNTQGFLNCICTLRLSHENIEYLSLYSSKKLLPQAFLSDMAPKIHPQSAPRVIDQRQKYFDIHYFQHTFEDESTLCYQVCLDCKTQKYVPAYFLPLVCRWDQHKYTPTPCAWALEGWTAKTYFKDNF